MWSAVDNILCVLVHVFSHALARGGCQHTCSDLVHCVITMVVADPLQTLSFPVTILAQDYVLTCCYAAGVLKSAPCLLACCFALSWGLASS